MARKVCEHFRERRGHDRLVARLLPSKEVNSAFPKGSEFLTVELIGNPSSAIFLYFELNAPYDFRLNILPIGPGLAIKIRVPDLPEALHLAGIILDDLSADIVGIGQRMLETNLDLLAVAPHIKSQSGAMDRCDGVYLGRLQRLSVAPCQNFEVTTLTTFTPYEAFIWAARKVSFARAALRGTEIRAAVWGGRGHNAAILNSPAAGQAGYCVLELADELGGVFRVEFLLDSGRLDDILIARAEPSQALHIIGMILHAMGVSSVKVGSRDHEQNEEVLARPLRPDESSGRMVRASNLVAHIEDEA